MHQRDDLVFGLRPGCCGGSVFPYNTSIVGLRGVARLVWEAVVPRRVANGGVRK